MVRAYVLLLSLVLLAACRPAATPEVEGEVVVLDSAEAARLAREIRQQVSAQPAEGLALSLWAPEQLVEDPIALTVDPGGRVFVTGSSRSGGLLDIRGHPTWTTEALAMRSVEDMRAFFHRELAPGRSADNPWLPDLNADSSRDWHDLTALKDRLYRIEDTQGDGLADRSQVLLTGFDTEVTDVAGGLLAFGDDLYLAAAPDLWRYPGAVKEGVVRRQESLSHGYGTHPGFFGHGLSGVTLGPDGRLYWSVGDMGLNVEDAEGKAWALTHQGAILRAEPDGSGFEVFAQGLRNVHEFGFDDHGNLVSVDNDGDHPGETERVVYLVEGSDSGWRTNWQFGKYTDPDNNGYKVWMDESLFKPRFEGQAAYITPPVASYHSGPAGMVYNPGTALGEAWRGHFFVSEYTGSPATSRVHAFRLRPEGAGFALADERVALSGILTTGMAFGPDGALYLADWIEGWDSKGRGRIWKLDAPAEAASPLRAETRRLLAEPFDDRADGDVAALLGHADQRVRMKAQLALAARTAADALLGAARQTAQPLARLHGLWGVGQLARRDARHAATLVPFLRDADPEVRAQAAKVLGDVRHGAAGAQLVPMLQDSSARVRFFAAEALGRIVHRPAVQPLIEMLAANDDRDVYLRHAGALALARLGAADAAAALSDHPSRGLRIAAVVALRRMRHVGVARFLRDADPYLVAEAARAINDDASIEEALPELARVLEEARFTDEALLRRALNANGRVGTPEAAQRLAAYAARAGAPEAMRAEALAILGVWGRPSPLDRVDGSYRGPVTRDPAPARAAVTLLLEPLLTGGPAALKVALSDAAARLALDAAEPLLRTRAREDAAPEVRIAALQALHTLGAAGMDEVVRGALADRDPGVRMTALELIPSLNLPEDATAGLLSPVLAGGSVEERQRALAVLGRLRGPEAQRLLGGLLDQLVAGRLPPEVQLDVMEAVDASRAPALRDRLRQYQATRPRADSLAAYAEALQGGDARQGERVFYQSASGQCTRCHALGIEGATVGPDLSGVGARLSRAQLLEALVAPSARLAPGFGVVTLTLKDGTTVAGLLREEGAAHLVVQTSSGEDRRVARTDVAGRNNAPSAMPPMGQLLARRELRDLVAFLSSLK